MRRFAPLMLAWFFGTLPAFASYDLERVLTELQNREKTIDVIQFDFKQEINFTQMQNKTVVSGEAVFGKAGKMRITKRLPDQQVTISDGKKVWVFNPVYKQVWEGSSKKWMDSSVFPKGIVPLNNYVEDLRANFNLRFSSSTEGGDRSVHVLAEPKNKALGYRIEMTVATDSWLPTKTVYQSDTANVVTYLSKHLVNPDVKDSVFRFSAPKGTDVIPFN
jgi:outer membrane lipoprotein carrier protein